MTRSGLFILKFLYFFWIFPLFSQPAEETTQQRLDRGEIVLEIRKEGDKSIVRAQSKPKIEARWIWKALEDYENFPKFFPNMQICRIEKREKRSSEEEVFQVYNELIISFKKIFYTLEIVHHPQEGFIRWSMLSGNIKHTEGFWKIIDEGDKSGLTYEVYTDPGMWVPQFIYESMTTETVRKVILGATERAHFLKRSQKLQIKKEPLTLRLPPPFLWEDFLGFFFIFCLLYFQKKNALPLLYLKNKDCPKNYSKPLFFPNPFLN